MKTERQEMEKYRYEAVSSSNGDFNPQEDSNQWKLFFKQLLVCSGVLTIFFTVGMSFGTPTVLVQQLKQEANSTEVVSVATASWLTSVFGYASLPWIFILTALSHFYGRKKTFTIVAFNTILYFILFFFSVTTSHLLYIAIVLGMSHAASFTVSILILAEYTSPEYRGVFLTMKTASVFWGIWCSNIIGTFFHWKYISVIGFVCSLSSLTAFIWPESPYWLASKGRIEECKEAHRWLKGTGRAAEKELLRLTTEKMEAFKLGSLKDLGRREFYLPTLICCLMVMQFYASGKFVCSVYSLEILKNMTSENAAYLIMLTLDGITILAMYMGCFVSGFVRRRTQLFTSSVVGLVFLFGLSLYLYLISLKLEGFPQSFKLTLAIMALFSVAMSCGPGIMSSSVLGELIPMKYKNLCTIIVSIWFQVLNSTLLKIFPYVDMAFGLHGTFLSYGITMLTVTVILYKILPETKNKTLQEIEDFFK